MSTYWRDRTLQRDLRRTIRDVEDEIESLAIDQQLGLTTES